MASEPTGWPLVEERAPLARSTPRVHRTPRSRPRSAWVLAVLAFVCGGLVSAAGFSIGWRHQAQQGSAAEAKLASATARSHRLQASLAAATGAAASAHQAERRARKGQAAAEASARALAGAAAKVAGGTTASRRAANALSGDAGALTSSTAKLTSELKTLETYLTTTPTGQLDAGYIQSQTAYLLRQLSALQSSGGTVSHAAATFDAVAKKLAQQTAALSGGH